MPDTTPVQPASPTGIAVLPQSLLKVATAIVGLAALVLGVLPLLPDAPWVHTAQAVATGVIGLGAVLGISSQGIRKASSDAAAKVVDVPTALAAINEEQPK